MQTTTEAVQQQPQTRVYKSHYGWQGYTRYPIGTRVWELTTMKRNNGIIATTVIRLNEDNKSYMMFGNNNGDQFTLNPLPKGTMATEKSITMAHMHSIALFEAKKDAGELPQEKAAIAIGQVLFTDGPWEKKRRAVYELLGGGRYRTVLLDASNIQVDDHVRPISEKFGIGTYYKDGDVISVDEVNALLDKALENIKQAAIIKQQQEAQAAQIRQEKIEVGMKVLPTLPSWAKAVIIAEQHKNTSDAMSDYFAHETEQVVYLAFSSHEKDLFAEMREACKNSDNEDIRIFANAPTVNDNGEERTNENSKWWHPKDEHREKYSGGSGYYLKHGHRHSSGWAVEKERMNMDARTLQAMQIAIAEGRFFAPLAEPEKLESGGGGTNASWSRNEKFNGIEIRFSSKPADEIISRVRGAGFRYKRAGGDQWWYKKETASTLAFAETLCAELNS